MIQGAVFYSFEAMRVLTGEDYMRLSGFVGPSGLHDREAKVASKCLSASPIVGLLSYLLFLSRAAPWWQYK